MNIQGNQRSGLNRESMQGTAWMILSYGIKLSLQLISFILLARTLGPQDFGIYMGILSFCILLEPLFDLGAHNLVIRDITRHRDSARAVGDSLIVSLLVLPFGVMLLVLGKTLVFDEQSTVAVLAIGLSQFVGGRSMSLGLGVNIANARISHNALLEILNGMIRLAVVASLVGLHGDLMTWIELQLLGNLLLSALVFGWIFQQYGIRCTGVAMLREHAVTGIHFAVANTARNVNTELDKVMIYQFVSVVATGIYSAAVRFVVISVLPVNALLSAVQRHFFIQGDSGYRQARRFAVSLLPATASYGAVAATVLWFFPDLIVALLGEGYEESSAVMRYLAFFPFLQSILLPYADAMTGAGLQKQRSHGTLLSMFCNLLLNLWLIPLYGWSGAVFATLVSQMLFLFYVTLYARKFLDRQPVNNRV